MPTLYALEILRAERNASGTSTSAPRADNLYIRVKLGKDQRPKTKLQDLEGDAIPTWNETLILSSQSDSIDGILLVELKQRLRLGRSQCLGSVEASMKDLMSRSANGEVLLGLHPDKTSAPLTLDVLRVRLRPISTEEKERLLIDSAIQGAKQGGIGEPSADPFEAFDKRIALADSWADVAKSLEKILEGVDSFVIIFDELSKVHPFLSFAWQAVSCVYKVSRKQQEADKWFAHLVYIMEFILGIICSPELDREKVKTLEGTICQFMQQSAECCIFIQHYISHGFIGRALDQTSLQKIKDFTERFRDLRGALNLGVALQTSLVLSRMADKIDIMSKKVDIMHLRNTLNPPNMDASSRKECLPGTRTEILEEIIHWFLSDTSENIFWLHGAAGSGKSTISMTISGYCQEMCRRGAHLFFEREKSDPYHVIRALAYQLAAFDQRIAEHVSKAVKEHNGIATDRLALQFKKLIFEPLRAVADSVQGPVIIILDALDECGTSESRKELLGLIKSEFGKLPRSFRFLITGRPERDISQKLVSQRDCIRTLELDISSDSGREDVFFYIRSEMQSIFEEEHIKLIPAWDQKMDLLGNAANGLFIWASTAAKTVAMSDNPFVDLETLVACCRPTDTGSHLQVEFGMSSLYENILRNSGIRWDSYESRSRFAKTLGLVLLGKVPLSIAAIDGILGFPETSSSRLIIERLQSILASTSGDSDAPVRIYHTSFSDYLTAAERSRENPGTSTLLRNGTSLL